MNRGVSPYVGQRIRVATFRRHGGRGAWGTIVAFKSERWDGHRRPLVVRLDNCPKALYKFAFTELEYMEAAQ